MADAIDPRKYSAFVLIHPLESYAGAPRNVGDMVAGLPTDVLKRYGLWANCYDLEAIHKIVPDLEDFLGIFKKAILSAWVETAHNFAVQGKQVILFVPKTEPPYLPKALTRIKGVEVVTHASLPKGAEVCPEHNLSKAECSAYFARIVQPLAEKIRDPSNVLLGGLSEDQCYLSIAHHLVEDTNAQKVTIRTDLTDRLKVEVAERTQTKAWIIAQSQRLGELYRWFVYVPEHNLLEKMSQFEWTFDKETLKHADDYVLTLRGHGADGIETPFVRYIRPRRRARKIPVLKDIPAQLVYEWRPRKTRR